MLRQVPVPRYGEVPATEHAGETVDAQSVDAQIAGGVDEMGDLTGPPRRLRIAVLVRSGRCREGRCLRLAGLRQRGQHPATHAQRSSQHRQRHQPHPSLCSDALPRGRRSRPRLRLLSAEAATVATWKAATFTAAFSAAAATGPASSRVACGRQPRAQARSRRPGQPMAHGPTRVNPANDGGHAAVRPREWCGTSHHRHFRYHHQHPLLTLDITIQAARPEMEGHALSGR
jgi:hypothetical protein